MGKVKPPTAAQIADLNPGISPDVLAVFLDARKLYREASDNIAKNGAVTGHPKTGAPIVNPYLEIRDISGRTICRFHKENPEYDSGE